MRQTPPPAARVNRRFQQDVHQSPDCCLTGNWRSISRRRWLQIGALGWLASGRPAAGPGASFAAWAAGAAGRDAEFTPRATPIRSCILVFHYGGPSHLDTFDPKPHAAREIRGEYQTIATAVPGVQIGEHLPLLAQQMDQVALVRSVHHPMRNHNSAAAEVLTGRTPAGGDLELLADEAGSFPTLGSAVSHALGTRAHLLPYVALPYTIYNVVQLPGQTPGFLGGTVDRFQVSGNPNQADFRVSALTPPGNRNSSELTSREALLRTLDLLPPTGPLARMDVYQQRALQLVSSDTVRNSFEIEQEPVPVRERYGRNLLGQSLLLARRLVESGVNFVTVFDGQHNGQEANWDSHSTIFPRHRQLIPPADQGLAALIADLRERGLLESTLVISLGEFGRTPRINASAGRDHWPDCFTVALAGGGVRGGQVWGASDAIGAYPDRDPVTPADLAATILWSFGISPEFEVRDQAGRPLRLAEGQPLVNLFG